MIFQSAFAWWAAALRGMEPVILSFGAAFAAIGLNDQPSYDIKLFSEATKKLEPLLDSFKGRQVFNNEEKKASKKDEPQNKEAFEEVWEKVEE